MGKRVLWVLEINSADSGWQALPDYVFESRSSGRQELRQAKAYAHAMDRYRLAKYEAVKESK